MELLIATKRFVVLLIGIFIIITGIYLIENPFSKKDNNTIELGRRSDSGTTKIDWNWLENTYWYTPEESLPCLRYNLTTETYDWCLSQQVWYISEYQSGYFIGVAASISWFANTEAPGIQARSAWNIIGSILPEGDSIKVDLFSRIPGKSSTTAIGRLKIYKLQTSFEIHLNSPNLHHWLYLQPVSPSSKAWLNLPGISSISVPHILQGLDPPARQHLTSTTSTSSSSSLSPYSNSPTSSSSSPYHRRRYLRLDLDRRRQSSIKN